MRLTILVRLLELKKMNLQIQYTAVPVPNVRQQYADDSSVFNRNRYVMTSRASGGTFTSSGLLGASVWHGAFARGPSGSDHAQRC